MVLTLICISRSCRVQKVKLFIFTDYIKDSVKEVKFHGHFVMLVSVAKLSNFDYILILISIYCYKITFLWHFLPVLVNDVKVCLLWHRILLCIINILKLVSIVLCSRQCNCEEFYFYFLCNIVAMSLNLPFIPKSYYFGNQ